MTRSATKSLPKILRAARERQGLSQAELAEMVGCSQSAISGWETESARGRSAAVVRALRLAAALKLRPADLP